ncbi:unnamed protein product [Pleuronectes platessa]|uniref:Tyr recombinase domain-containing protein n=1 Tax=Pleuronectes platessa TaxID=8262 RepID=A0A9N7UMT5_PLEPL|nr:unnamed protein product [Pleuronectes platessa]
MLHDLVRSCGLPPEHYSPHSLRIGAATTAALHLPAATLKSLGRWSSSAYQRYVRFHKEDILQAQKIMSSCPLEPRAVGGTSPGSIFSGDNVPTAYDHPTRLHGVHHSFTGSIFSCRHAPMENSHTAVAWNT